MTETQQLRVMALANAINDVLVGVDAAEAQTALTLAVCSTIIGLYPDAADWDAAMQGLGKGVATIMADREHTDFIRASVHPVTRGHA